METRGYIPPEARQTIPTPDAKPFNKERVVSLIDAILERRHNYLDNGCPANYDADFQEGQEPYFLNIWNREPGSGLGYVVFHDFLIYVGQNENFFSTNFTPAGNKLFTKAVEDGLIQQLHAPQGLANTSCWKVVGDPRANLEKIKTQLQS